MKSLPNHFHPPRPSRPLIIHWRRTWLVLPRTLLRYDDPFFGGLQSDLNCFEFDLVAFAVDGSLIVYAIVIGLLGTMGAAVYNEPISLSIAIDKQAS